MWDYSVKTDKGYPHLLLERLLAFFLKADEIESHLVYKKIQKNARQSNPYVTFVIRFPRKCTQIAIIVVKWRNSLALPVVIVSYLRSFVTQYVMRQ